MQPRFYRIIFAFVLILTFSCNLCFADTSTDNRAENQSLLKIIFFSSVNCNECLEVKQALPELIAGFEDYISIERYDIETSEANLENFLLYQEKYKTGNVAPPVIFIGQKALIGEKAIINQLQNTIIQQITHSSEILTTGPNEPNLPLKKPVEKEPSIPQKSEIATEPNLPSKDNDKQESIIISQFNKFSIFTVALAGLFDGINPCAFTTIVFFISMLAYLGKTRFQLIAVGVGFTFAVFVTYLLIGLGLLGTVKIFLVGRGVSKILTYTIACLTFVLAGWSFVDFIKFLKTKSVKSMTLGLPQSVKTRIHKIIRVGIGTRGLVAGSVSVGVLVALLESICTGQVYLPIIVFVAKSSKFRMDAIAYLVFYNLMFILPLVVILIITYFGVKSESLGNFFGRHIALSKILMTLLFLTLGIILLVT